jgi:hypothetical protein
MIVTPIVGPGTAHHQMTLWALASEVWGPYGSCLRRLSGGFWIRHIGKLDLSWHILRSIDFDHQTAEDRHVLEVLKKTAGA